jgi:hypothetical protein
MPNTEILRLIKNKSVKQAGAEDEGREKGKTKKP